jgi:hypothetical protein
MSPGDIAGFRPDIATDVPRGTPTAARLPGDLEPLGAGRANPIALPRASPHRKKFHLDARPHKHSAVYCARRSNMLEYGCRQAARAALLMARRLPPGRSSHAAVRRRLSVSVGQGLRRAAPCTRLRDVGGTATAAPRLADLCRSSTDRNPLTPPQAFHVERVLSRPAPNRSLPSRVAVARMKGMERFGPRASRD